LGILQKNSLDWVIYKDQELLSVLEVRKLKIKETADSVTDEGQFPIDGAFSLHLHMVEARQLFGVIFIKKLIPFLRAQLS
jgi:hypothetical protein